jgi:CBS domain containing-hemolysin-like protein
MNPRDSRRRFVQGLLMGVRILWPILSGLLVFIIGLGLIIGLLEGWSVQESVYFSFVTGLTIGYGDLAPKSLFARVLAIFIGMCGIILTGLVAAVAVEALRGLQGERGE